MSALPSGSMLAVTHPTQDFNPGEVEMAVAAATRSDMTLVPRTKSEVGRIFGDWEMLDPGLVPVMAWRPDGEPPANPEAAYYWAGEISMPVGLMFGAADQVLDPETHGLSMRGRIDGLDVEMVEGVGHMPQYAEPERVAAFIRRMADRAFALAPGRALL